MKRIGPLRGKALEVSHRPTHCKLSSDGSNKILTNEVMGKRMSEEALANAEIIINKLSEKKRHKVKSRQRIPPELMQNLKSLEDKEPESSEFPISTISSNCRKNIKSRKSSRGSRNRSSSNSNKPNQKFIITKSKKGSKSKNLKKLEKYKIPFEKEKKAVQVAPLSTKERKNNIFLLKHTKITHNPYPGQVNLKKEISRNYRHSKSNSQTVNHASAKKFEEFHNKEGDNIFSNKKGLILNNINHEQPVIVPQGVYENGQNVVIFPKDFNTVKYSQSPFLNKLTNLKQRPGKKVPVKEPYTKGHKSRNSMFPKSYTYQRRENDIYYKNQIRERSNENKLDEELKGGVKLKTSNPYTNINPYSNGNPKEDQKYPQLSTEKYKTQTDITRSKTVIDVTGESSKQVSAKKTVAPKAPAANMKVGTNSPSLKRGKVTDYYQISKPVNHRNQDIQL